MAEYFEERRERLDRFEVSIGHTNVGGGAHPFSYLRMHKGVCVLALVGSDVLLVREHRFAVGGWQDELPAGTIDPGETPAEAAARELLEETGHRALGLEDLGSFYPSFGSTDEEIFLFAAECDEHAVPLALDGGEELSAYRVPLAEVVRMVADGRIAHGAGIAALARWAFRHPEAIGALASSDAASESPALPDNPKEA